MRLTFLQDDEDLMSMKPSFELLSNLLVDDGRSVLSEGQQVGLLTQAKGLVSGVSVVEVTRQGARLQLPKPIPLLSGEVLLLQHEQVYYPVVVCTVRMTDACEQQVAIEGMSAQQVEAIRWQTHGPMGTV